MAPAQCDSQVNHAKFTSAISVGHSRRRRISRRAGRALEMLGHAIEYLADERALRAEALPVDDPAFEAIQLLMSWNREIYFSCPVSPSLGERIRTLLGGRNR